MPSPTHTADTIRQTIRDAHRWEWSQEEYWGVAQLLNLYGDKAWFEAERQGLHRLAGRIGDHGRALEVIARRPEAA